MSLFKKIGSAIGGVARAAAPFASVIPGAGPILGAAGMLGMRSSVAPAGPAILEGGGTVWGQILRGIGGMTSGATVSRMGSVGGAVVAGGAAVGRGAMTAARAANEWCKRQPAWCVSVGGIPAIISMIQSGTLPMPRRRRRRGLSPRDLRGFYKTSRLMRKVAGTIGLRRSGGRGRPGSSTMITQN